MEEELQALLELVDDFQTRFPDANLAEVWAETNQSEIVAVSDVGWKTIASVERR